MIWKTAVLSRYIQRIDEMERIIRFLLEELTRVPWPRLRLLVQFNLLHKTSSASSQANPQPRKHPGLPRASPGSRGRSCQEQRRRLPGREGKQLPGFSSLASGGHRWDEGHRSLFCWRGGALKDFAILARDALSRNWRQPDLIPSSLLSLS